MARKTPRIHEEGKKGKERKRAKQKEEEEEKKRMRRDLLDRKPKIPKKKDNATQTSLTKQERYRRVLKMKYGNVEG